MLNQPQDSTVRALNMLVCDGAHRDPGSGKWSLLGLFNSINARQFPTVHPQFVVYLGLLGVNGNMPLRIQIVASDRKDEPIAKIDAQLTVHDTRMQSEVVIPFRGVTFTKAGGYLIQVYTSDHFVAEREIAVVAS